MISNTKEGYISLWRTLRETYEDFSSHRKRFCVRRLLQHWHSLGLLPCEGGVDDFIWEVCLRTERGGYDDLPDPHLYPRPHRELLRAIAVESLGIRKADVDLEALDSAYSIAFPESTPLNINKKRRKI